MKKKNWEPSDEDYCALDDAIATVMKWSDKIKDELTVYGYNVNNLDRVLDAMNRVHSPKDVQS